MVAFSFSEEKRRNVRLRLYIKGRYSFLSNPQKWYDCTIDDLNLHGISFVGESSFFEGDLICMRFSLDKEIILVNINVIYCIGKRAGGTFVDNYTEELEAIIKKFLEG